ncbi:MAG: nucleotide exchange factor GrpE [Patescibacteria group bacterium]
MKNTKTSKPEKKLKVDELKNQLARALADYDNLRKRSEIEREVLLKFSSERITARILPILDSIENAQMHLKDSGLAIIIDDFKKLLYDERLEEILPKKGNRFNEELHEAIEVSEGGKKGTISEIILQGWKFVDGQVLRHAKVTVYGDKIERKN